MQISTDFQTPISVAEFMVELIPKNVKTILEPTPGVGNILKVLQQKNIYEITAPEDYYLLEKRKFDCIVANPPFSSKSADLTNAPKDIDLRGMRVGYQMLTDFMEMSDNIIALMPWFTISDSDVRLRILKQFGMKSLTALPRKTFDYARIQTCIIELEKGFKGETIFNYFDWKKL